MLNCMQSDYVDIYKHLGTCLRLELIEAKQNKDIIGKNTTKSFLDFLVIIGNEKNLVSFKDSSYLCGKLRDIHTNIGGVRENEMMIKINDFVSKSKRDYFLFAENCRRVAKNIVKSPSVRLDWDSEYLKDAVSDYENFIKYLRPF